MAGWVAASDDVTLPAGTPTYAIGDLVANSATAGSVVPLIIAADPGTQAFWLRKLTLRHSQASVTNSNFRLWGMNASPTVTNGDDGALAGTFLATVLFEPILVDVEALLTGGGAIGSSLFDAGLLRIPKTSYWLIEARAAYTRAAAEVFTLELEGEPCP